MEFSELESNLAKSKPCPVIHLVGEEYFLIRRSLAKIEDSLTQRYTSFAGREEYEAESGWSEAVSSLRTVSLFGDAKLIVVTDFEKALKGASRIEAISKEIRKITENPPHDAYLVLLSNEIDKRTRLAKQLAEQTWEVDCSPPKPYQVEKWLRSKVGEAKLRMSQAALNALLSRTGGSLEDLEHELSKLSLYAQSGQEISEEQVRLLVEDREEEPIYQLYNALDTGNRSEVFRVMNDLLTHIEPIQVLSGLSRHVRQILSLRAMRKQGHADLEIQKSLEVSSFQLRKLTEGTSGLKDNSLRRMLRLLEKADERIKTGSQSGSPFVYHLLASL